VEWLLLAIPVGALIALFGPGRYPSAVRYSDASDWPPDDDDDSAGVREPRRPPPHAGDAAVALAASSPGLEP
jgi:hypothetical protein